MLSAELNNWTASELHRQWPSGASLWLSRVPGQLLTHLCLIYVFHNMLASHLVRVLLNKLLVVSMPISIALNCVHCILCLPCALSDGPSQGAIIGHCRQ